MEDVFEINRLRSLRACRILDTAPEDFFDDIVDLVVSMFKVPIAAISLVDEDRQWFKASRGLRVSQTTRDIAFCDVTIKSDKCFAVEDALADTRFHRNPLVQGDPGIRCYLGAPLILSHGERIGSLCIIGTEPREFSSIEAKQLEKFAAIVARRIEDRANSHTDYLTGAASKEQFETQVSQAIYAFFRYDADSLVCLADIDDFKLINDLHGHQIGDEALKFVAKQIQDNLRINDLVCRIGGDEFGFVINSISEKEANASIERMKTAIETSPISKTKNKYLRMSFGRTCLSEILSKYDEKAFRKDFYQNKELVAQVLSTADKDLYSRKSMRAENFIL